MTKTAPSIGTRFALTAPNAKAVYLAGTFNEWRADSLAMKKDAQGLWTHTLPLPAGDYEYKFVVDGQWCCELGCEGVHTGCTKCVSNPMGTMNRKLSVA